MLGFSGTNTSKNDIQIIILKFEEESFLYNMYILQSIKSNGMEPDVFQGYIIASIVLISKFIDC